MPATSCADTPHAVQVRTWGHYIIWTGFSHIYKDLQRAQAYYELHRLWMTATFVQPGALTHDKQSGHEVMIGTKKSFLSFLDLAAGMIECGSKDKTDTEWDWQGVTVIPTGKSKFNPKAPLMILRGSVWTIFPQLYSVFHSTRRV